MRDLKEGVDYTTSTWTGNDPAKTPYTNYQCTRCAFTTLYFEEKMVKHYEHEDKHKHHWAYPVDSEEAKRAADLLGADVKSSAAQMPLKY